MSLPWALNDLDKCPFTLELKSRAQTCNLWDLTLEIKKKLSFKAQNVETLTELQALNRLTKSK